MDGDETLLLTAAVVTGLSVMLMVADLDGQTIVLKVAGAASLCKADRVGIDGESDRLGHAFHFGRLDS
jgi:hypothetical protein